MCDPLNGRGDSSTESCSLPFDPRSVVPRRRRRRFRPLPWPTTVPASPGDLFSAGLTQLSQSRVLSVPEDVVDALESDLAVEAGRASNDTLQKSSKVVLKWEGEWFWFLRASTALHVPISMIPILSEKMHSTGTVRQPSQPLNHREMTQLHQTPRPSGESLMCRLAAVQFPRQNQFQWWRKCPWVQHFGTHCDGWTQWISLVFLLAEQWSCDHLPDSFVEVIGQQ